MKKKRGINIKRFLLLVFILILLIVLLVVSVLVDNKREEEKLAEENRRKTEEYENSIADYRAFSKEYESQTILPRNIVELYNYEGDYERDDFYKNIKLYTDYLSYLSENVDVSKIDTFYTQNSEEIESITGNTGIENFTELINKLQGKNVDVTKLRYAEIEKQSSSTEDGYFKFVINIYYGEETAQESSLEKLSINVSWAEDTSKEKEFIYELK